MSIEDARAELAVIAARLERSYPDTNAGIGAAVVEARGVGPDAWSSPPGARCASIRL